MKREAESTVTALEEEVKGAEPSSPKQEGRLPKQRIALLVGYNGSEFSGSQKNPGVRTVEEELEKALYRLGMIAEFNFGDLKKIGWNRATRTDKWVHALQNCFSCKVHISKDEEQDEAFREKLNAELPEDIRVFCIVRPTSRFNTKINADDREYSYYLPTFTLRSINEGWYGAGI